MIIEKNAAIEYNHRVIRKTGALCVMEQKKLIKNRRSYYDDYKKTASGEYVYAGPQYEFVSKNGKERKRWMLEIIILNIIAFAAVLVPGFLLVPGLNYCAYVILPYAAGILLAGYLFVVLVRLAAAKDDIKAWEYDKSVKVLPVATVFAVIVAVVALICEVVFIIANGAGGMTVGAVVFIACHAVSAAVSVFMVLHVKTAEWMKKPSENV